MLLVGLREMPTNVKVPILSAKYAGISGSDISNAVFNAALRAARLDEDLFDSH